MNNFGFIRVAAAVPGIKVADIRHNTEEICRIISETFDKGVSLVVFPELSLTGSTCGDLFHHNSLLLAAEEGLRQIIEKSRGKKTAVIVGVPVKKSGRLYNCAAVICNGRLTGMVTKSSISRLSPFHSGRDLAPETTIRYAGQTCIMSPYMLFEFNRFSFAVEVGEDAYSTASTSAEYALAGATIIAHPSADKADITGNSRVKSLIAGLSGRNISAYVHASAGFGESSQDYTFAGDALIYENGALVKENERWDSNSNLSAYDIDADLLETKRRRSDIFSGQSADGHERLTKVILGNDHLPDVSKDLIRDIEAHPFTPSGCLEQRCQEALSIQTNALMTRLSHINCKKIVIGISGGLDSTLALLVAVRTFDHLGWSREGIIGITMPGYGTSVRTKGNADRLMEDLGITSMQISITAACDQHFKDINQDPSVHDAAYENSQARERTQILMDYANRVNGIVLGTGDLSELALGWATYNGDHMSMYGINAGVPKTLVKELVVWAASNLYPEVKDILLDITQTPISPELVPTAEDGNIAQVTEDLVGPYELHDFFLYSFVSQGYSKEKIRFMAKKAFSHYSMETIDKWLNTFIKRFFSQQFKRSCMPDGPKIGSVGLSPRGGWIMPSDISGIII